MKHKSEKKCMQARLILTDVLKTKLGQDYLNRWNYSQQKEMLQSKPGGSSEFCKSANSQAHSHATKQSLIPCARKRICPPAPPPLR
ncbi:hypothetical protein GN956_G26249 [Arapaima gigas]